MATVTSLNFQLIEPDRLLWPGKLGIVTSAEHSEKLGLPEWEATVRQSNQIVEVPSGRRNERATFVFASERDLGRVELVYQHGYIWPDDPPRSGRAIMEELIEHLNGLKKPDVITDCNERRD